MFVFTFFVFLIHLYGKNELYGSFWAMVIVILSNTQQVVDFFSLFLFTEDLFVWLDTYIVILTRPVF